jgi:hypothetical protein
MFDATRALEKWRGDLAATGEMTGEQIAELEAHLVDIIDDLEGAQLSDEERFVVATHRLGHPTTLRHEFAKLTPWATWRAPVFWATVGVAWVLGVEAILDTAVPLGALVATRHALPMSWLNAWTFVVYVGGPLIAFLSVRAWMRRYSVAHPHSTRALFLTVAAAVAVRLAAMPLGRYVNARAWTSFDRSAWRSFQEAWQASTLAGLLLVAAIGIVVLVRFRDVHARDVS